MKKVYLLAFNTNTLNIERVHSFVKAWASIIDWWHYLLPAYLIVSYSTAEELSQQFRTQFPGSNFLIIEVNLSNSNGWLSKEAWDWIHEQA